MYSLRVTCSRQEADRISGELWEAGTVGIRELDDGDRVVLIASFEHACAGASEEDESVDWVGETQRSWNGREVGERLFLVPPWNDNPTPLGRKRLTHNPGLACGTGEHPCTQLALMALEACVRPGRRQRVVDIGTGSGILAIAALHLGAASAIAVDPDETALAVARGNFELNEQSAPLVGGSAECLADGCADITVANISATVLLFLADELLRITAARGRLILTGFEDSELMAVEKTFSATQAGVLQSGEWRCLSLEAR
jgi:ribosomal protein L11 methyltransferase